MLGTFPDSIPQCVHECFLKDTRKCVLGNPVWPQYSSPRWNLLSASAFPEPAVIQTLEEVTGFGVHLWEVLSLTQSLQKGPHTFGSYESLPVPQWLFCLFLQAQLVTSRAEEPREAART